MIRSGSTLQYNLVRSLIEKTGVGKGEGWFSPDQLHEKCEQFEDWGNDELLHAVKSHVIPPHSEEMLAKDILRFCYIYRDIRDVAASVKNKWQFEGEKLLEVLDKAIATYYGIETMHPVLMQKYENVIDNLPGAVREIAKFLNLHPGEDFVNEVAEENSLPKVQVTAQAASRNFSLKAKSSLLQIGSKLRVDDLMRKIGISESWIRYLRNAMLYQDQRTLLHPDHISKNQGSVGVWRNELTEKESSEISYRFEQWLQEAKYT